jgi:hypothetical protein
MPRQPPPHPYRVVVDGNSFVTCFATLDWAIPEAEQLSREKQAAVRVYQGNQLLWLVEPADLRPKRTGREPTAP